MEIWLSKQPYPEGLKKYNVICDGQFVGSVQQTSRHKGIKKWCFTAYPGRMDRRLYRNRKNAIRDLLKSEGYPVEDCFYNAQIRTHPTSHSTGR